MILMLFLLLLKNKQTLFHPQDFVFSASEAVAGYFVSLLVNSLFKKKKNPPISVWAMTPGKEGKDGPCGLG